MVRISVTFALIVVLLALSCNEALFAQDVRTDDMYAYSVRLGIGVFFDPTLFTHPEVIRKIEQTSGIKQS